MRVRGLGYRLSQRSRKKIDELFGEGKDWHGLRRFRRRGLLRVRQETYLRVGPQSQTPHPGAAAVGMSARPRQGSVLRGHATGAPLGIVRNSSMPTSKTIAVFALSTPC